MKTTVPVTAEWARWGKAKGDAGYRLLECSTGTLSREIFSDVLTHYSPGTLEDLPQATISCFSGNQRSYLGLAIHHETGRAKYDVSGREIVPTSYFCVPFNDLAASAVSYSAMYHEFRHVRLPYPDQSPIKADLANADLANSRSAGPVDKLAARVAALLLTNRPVCVLGADRTNFAERLQFLDTVASLLPYGMRTGLPASTWASSTFQEHWIRLFFASARRTTDEHRSKDHVVIWGEPDSALIGDRRASDYLSWLGNDIFDRVAQLATATEQISFRSADVDQMLEQLDTLSEPQTVQVRVDKAISGSDDPAMPGERALARGQQPATVINTRPAIGVEDLLTSCAEHLRSGDASGLESDIDRLRQQAGDQVTDTARQGYRELMRDYRLLREDLPIDSAWQALFYNVLLWLAFGRPLAYTDYCDVETWLGYSEAKPLHRPALQAMVRFGLGGQLVRLLVAREIGDDALKQELRANPAEIQDLLVLATNRELRVQHARAICELALSHIAATSRRDRPALRAPLHAQGFLAQLLQRLYPDAIEHQRGMLRDLLKDIYGSKLDQSAIRDIFAAGETAPTVALYYAVWQLSAPADRDLVGDLYLRGLNKNSGLQKKTSKPGTIKRILPGQHAAEPTKEQPRPHVPGQHTAEPTKEQSRPLAEDFSQRRWVRIVFISIGAIAVIAAFIIFVIFKVY
jgi:hypothetical protein